MIVVDEDRIVKNPLVSVRVHSYNQEQYIEQCLDSILAQKTSFEYEIVLANNPSEDSTKEICIDYQKRHPDKIRLLLREHNMGFFANFFETGRMCRGKYIARCDADDYWCDENKLQRQVDILEADNSIGLVYTGSNVLYDSTKIIKPAPFFPYKGFKEHLLREPIMTLTVMHRKELYEKYIQDIHPEDKNWLMEDSPISFWYSVNSKIVGIDTITAVYRVVDNSISHPVDYPKKEAFNKSLLGIRLFFYNKYQVADEKIRKGIFNDYYRRDLNDAYTSLQLKKYWSSLVKYKPNSIRNLGGSLFRLLLLCWKSI